jgi:hypothetical protein
VRNWFQAFAAFTCNLCRYLMYLNYTTRIVAKSSKAGGLHKLDE